MQSLTLGFALIGVGVAVSAYHINRIFSDKPKVECFIGIVCGILFLNIGSNLVATGLHDKINKINKQNSSKP